MVMVFVPAGEFTMGSDRYPDEQPIHQVYLDAFWIDQTEVTNAMYTKCVRENRCDTPRHTFAGWIPLYFGELRYNDYPVVHIDWRMANAYCEWAGRRLPTEAEWEKAARFTDGRTYPWGNNSPEDSLLNYNFPSGPDSVGSFTTGVSVYGAYDMAGNVYEWVSSLYRPYPYKSDDGRENIVALGSRILRGGYYNSKELEVRTTDRVMNDPLAASGIIGFRCALSYP